jgi:hypothetical protein
MLRNTLFRFLADRRESSEIGGSIAMKSGI